MAFRRRRRRPRHFIMLPRRKLMAAQGLQLPCLPDSDLRDLEDLWRSRDHFSETGVRKRWPAGIWQPGV